MTDLKEHEVASVTGGVIADRWGQGCTDPGAGKDPKTPPMAEVEL